MDLVEYLNKEAAFDAAEAQLLLDVTVRTDTSQSIRSEAERRAALPPSEFIAMRNELKEE